MPGQVLTSNLSVLLFPARTPLLLLSFELDHSILLISLDLEFVKFLPLPLLNFPFGLVLVMIELLYFNTGSSRQSTVRLQTSESSTKHDPHQHCQSNFCVPNSCCLLSHRIS